MEMFQNITCYLLKPNKTDPNDVTSSDVMVTSLFDDNDWLLVQPDFIADSEKSQALSEKSIAESDDDDYVCIETEQCLDDVNDGGMTESWLITPPACFTAEEAVPSPILTNSLEDLLIEHPSMSVYNNKHKHQRRDGLIQNKEPLPSVFHKNDAVKKYEDEQNEQNAQISKSRLNSGERQLTRCIEKIMKQSVTSNVLDLSAKNSYTNLTHFKRHRSRGRHGNGSSQCR